MKYDHSSPSQIKTFRRCQKRWHYQSVMGERSPATVATVEGTFIHSVAECVHAGKTSDLVNAAIAHHKWRDDEIAILDGLSNKRLKSLAAWASKLPPGDISEHEMVLCTDSKRKIIGRIDSLIGEPLTVVDYKSYSNVDYLPTAEELEHDPQVQIYARYVRSKSTVEPIVKFVYINRTNGKIHETKVTPHIDGWDRIQSDVDKQFDLALTMTDQVQGNPQACADYGGCPFRHKCSDGMSTIAKKLIAMTQDMEIQAVSNLTRNVGINPPSSSSSPTIYMGCRPERGSVTHIDDWLASAMARVEKQYGVAHYILVEYAKGPAAVIAEMRTTKESLPIGLYVPKGSPFWSLLAPFRKYATIIVGE